MPDNDALKQSGIADGAGGAAEIMKQVLKDQCAGYYYLCAPGFKSGHFGSLGLRAPDHGV